MNLNEILTDMFLDANDFHDAHTVPMRERLEEADVDPVQAAEMDRTWTRALRTQRTVLQRLQGNGPSDEPSLSGDLDTRVPTRAELARLTDEELVEAIEACEASLLDCDQATTILNARESGHHTDAWFGDDAPAEWFQQLAQWFEAAVRVLRRLRQWRALADNRTATQFQPLDPGSPSVLVQVRVPQNLLERLDATLAGRPRSDAIREAITSWLDDAPPSGSGLALRGPEDRNP